MSTDAEDLRQLLDRLLANPENEVVEFKRAENDYDTDKIGRYVSALANEANLRSVDTAWLVFGIDDGTRTVVGTRYREDPTNLGSLKQQITQSTSPALTFHEIHELAHPNGRVLMMEIPAAPVGMPIAWKGHFYARSGESLVALDFSKLDAIRSRAANIDWSAAPVPDVGIDDLDPDAMQRARRGFAERHPTIPADDIAGWDDTTFLAKARLALDGRLTRGTLLLLGRSEVAHRIGPSAGQMTWKLVGEQEAYEHFGPPLLVNTGALASRIRNVKLRLMPADELVYREITKYDDRTILEALHNCIAHQDYTRAARIIVTEHPDRLTFVSVGEFYDDQPDAYLLGKRTPRRYRNPFLVEAMTELNLIDRLGYGISRMVSDQRRRFLPMPDYDLDATPGEVHLTIHGAVLDNAYSQMLMARTDLPLEDVLALDRVQKGKSLSKAVRKRLRRAGLIEGRYPHLRVSAQIAAATETRADYIRTRAQDDEHYMRLITDYIRQFGHADRRDIDRLLQDKLSDALDEQQKRNKVSNLLTKMRRDGTIINRGSRSRPRWELIG